MLCKIRQGIQIFDQNFNVWWFLSYDQKCVKTKVFGNFPVPEKNHENEAKIKVTMIIFGISLANFYMSDIFSSLNISISSNTARSLHTSPYLKECTLCLEY